MGRPSITREPALYTPFAKGTYSVAPGLSPLGEDFGNGAADGQVFQFDREFYKFREEKVAARRSGFARRYLTHDYSEAVASAIGEFIARRLATEHPAYFSLETQEEQFCLDCRLIGERLVFNKRWEWVGAASECKTEPRYTSALDALACQMQEDLAVTSIEGRKNWVSALHVCLPSHWTPETKIGRNFAQVHGPVAGSREIVGQADLLLDAMIEATDGLVRFVWGVQFDDRLNHHPDDLPRGEFDEKTPSAFLRVERQVLWGFPEVSASLFTIRPYLSDLSKINHEPERRSALASALSGMSPQTLKYKSLDRCREGLLRWLSHP